MQQITAKYQVHKNLFEIPFKKEDIIKDIHNRILGNIAYELEDFLEIERNEIDREIDVFHTNFFIASKKEFQELSDLLREIRYYITAQQFDKFKNLLYNYEK